MASQARSSSWKPRLAIVEIVRLFYSAVEEKGTEHVHAYYPTTYLAAAHEVTAAAFVVARVMPFLVPALNDDGTFNYRAEVGIASICMFIGSFNVGLAWRYWWLSAARSKFLAEPPSCTSRFNQLAIIMLAVSSNFALCIWLIPNKASPMLPAAIPVWTIHSIGRLLVCLYAVILYGAYLGNLLEAISRSKSEATKFRDNVFAGIYGCVVTYLVGAYSYHSLIALNKKEWLTFHGGNSWIMQLDIVFWTVCLLSVYSFTPQEQPLVVTSDVEPVLVTDSEESGIQEPRNCNCPNCPSWLAEFSIVKLLTKPLDERATYPKYFLGATHEVFGLTLIITWSLTLAIPVLRPQIFKHPARVIIGSFNPCFGWDYFPASWISVYCCSFNVYFSYRYAWFANLRRGLLRASSDTTGTYTGALSSFASYALGFSSNIWLCLWLLGPNPEDPYGTDLDGPEIFWWSVHTGIFVFMCVAEYLTYVGFLLDVGMGPRKYLLTNRQVVFAYVYGICCAYLVVVYGLNLAFHDKGSGEPYLGSGWFTQIADIIWMACVMSITSYLPEERPVRQQMHVPQISEPLKEEAE